MLVCCFDSFLLQDMFLSLQVFAFERQNMTFTVNELLTCFMNCDAGPAKIVEAKLLLDVAESQQTRYESCFHIPTDSFSHSRNDKLIV